MAATLPTQITSDSERPDSLRVKLLMKAIQRGDVTEVEVVLSGDVDVNTTTPHGTTPLMSAAAYGHLEIVRALLKRGAALNQKRSDGFTALALAAFFGQQETVRELLACGADVRGSNCALLTGKGTPMTWIRGTLSLLAAMRAFEITYAGYDEHQRGMETYWSLRWLMQEGVKELEATVLRENLVRADGMPLVLRVPSLPEAAANTRVRLAVKSVDLLERTIECIYRDTLAPDDAAVAAIAADPSEKA